MSKRNGRFEQLTNEIKKLNSYQNNINNKMQVLDQELHYIKKDLENIKVEIEREKREEQEEDISEFASILRIIVVGSSIIFTIIIFAEIVPIIKNIEFEIEIFNFFVKVIYIGLRILSLINIFLGIINYIILLKKAKIKYKNNKFFKFIMRIFVIIVIILYVVIFLPLLLIEQNDELIFKSFIPSFTAFVLMLLLQEIGSNSLKKGINWNFNVTTLFLAIISLVVSIL